VLALIFFYLVMFSFTFLSSFYSFIFPTSTTLEVCHLLYIEFAIPVENYLIKPVVILSVLANDVDIGSSFNLKVVDQSVIQRNHTIFTYLRYFNSYFYKNLGNFVKLGIHIKQNKSIEKKWILVRITVIKTISVAQSMLFSELKYTAQ